MKFGVEAIPNAAFWRDLPNLIKEGLVYAVLLARGQVCARIRVDRPSVAFGQWFRPT